MGTLRLSPLLAGLVFVMAPPSAAQWAPTGLPDGERVSALAASDVNGGYLFAATDRGVYRSADADSVWIPAGTGLPDTAVSALAVMGATLIAGVAGSGVFRSSDSGGSWEPTGYETSVSAPTALALLGAVLVSGNAGGGFFRSLDSGFTWIPASGAVPESEATSFAAFGSLLFAGTYGQGIFSSKDTGATWTRIQNVPAGQVTALAARGTDIFAGTSGPGVFLSHDEGATWSPINEGLSEGPILAFLPHGSVLYAAGADGVFAITENGGPWLKVGQGLPKTRINALSLAKGDLIAGTEGRGAWRRPLSDMPISLRRNGDGKRSRGSGAIRIVPGRAGMEIAFSATRRMRVQLSVYDAKGNFSAMVLDSRVAAGTHKAYFDGRALPEGLYFLRMNAEGNVLARTFVLSGY